MLAKRKEIEEQQKLKSEMDRVLDEGGNPIEAALWKLKLQKIEKDKELVIAAHFHSLQHIILVPGLWRNNKKRDKYR